MTANSAPLSEPVPTEEKVRFLSQPRSYAHGPEDVEVLETHMSWVFLAGPKVFKLKKPVRYAFLDFSSIAKRHRAVCDEVRLNRRLAPDVYFPPRALAIGRDGRLAIDGAGRAVDWLVEMRRLPEECNLERLIAAGCLTWPQIGAAARLLGDFYAALPSEEIAAEDYIGQFEVEHRKTAEVLTDPELTLDDPGLAAALDGFERAFDAARPLLRDRAGRGHVVEGHGDLRPEHLFLTEPPVIIDCLEFNRSLRLVDPLDEIAFLGMECAKLGADWVAGALYRALNGVLGAPPPELAEFYWRYRALLRARLSLLHLVLQPERTPWKWRPRARDYVALSQEPELMRRPPEGR